MNTVPLQAMSSFFFTLAGSRALPVADDAIPLSARETLRVAGLLPVLFRRAEGTWEAVCLCMEEALKHPALTTSRDWLPAYTPTLLRLRPFVRRPGGPILGSWAIDATSPLVSNDVGVPIFDPAKGEPSEGMRGVMEDLARLNEAFAEISNAIEGLVAASLLAPAIDLIAFRQPAVAKGYFAVDAHRLASLPAPSLAELAVGKLSSLDLALAAVFSIRWADCTFKAPETRELDARLASLSQMIEASHRSSATVRLRTTDAAVPPGGRRPPPFDRSFQYEIDDGVLLSFDTMQDAQDPGDHPDEGQM